MNLTELTQATTKELTNLQQNYQSVLQESVSLQATTKLLTYEIAKKEVRLEELTFQCKDIAKQAGDLSLKEKKDRDRYDKMIHDLEMKLTRQEAIATSQLEQQLADRVAALTAKEQDQSIRASELTKRIDRVTLAEDTLAKQLVSLTGRETYLTDLALTNAQAEASSANRLGALQVTINKREETLQTLADTLATRKAELVVKESEYAKRSDTLLIDTRKASEQAERLTALSDSYEQKLASFAEREQVLAVRDMQLADREGVARSRGSR